MLYLKYNQQKLMSKSIGFRCPDDIVIEIEKTVQLTGLDKTAVIIEMIKGLQAVSIDDRKKLPRAEAIYLVWTKSKLLYIGQTIDLQRRFASHHRLVSFLEAEARISWFDPSGCDRIEIEEALIDILEPTLNGKIVTEGDKRIQVLLSVDLWKAYRLYCFEQEVSMSDDVRKYITELLSKPRDGNGEALA